MWNINKHRHGTNSRVEGWNSKLNSIIRKQQPNIILLVRKLKEKAELVSWQLRSKERGEPAQKRKTIYNKMHIHNTRVTNNNTTT